MSLLIILSLTCCQQGMYNKQDSLKGFVVEQDVNIYQDDKKEWFQPNEEEVHLSEQLLKDKLSQLNVEKLNQNGQCPDIEKNLNRYIRQYVGYYDLEGNKVILINMLWAKDKDSFGDLRKEYQIVLDGCSHYWRVKVKLEDEELFDLQVNGSA